MAPLMTLLGVGITLWVSKLQAKQQLDAAKERFDRELDASERRAREERQHAAEEARKERLAQARRQIYVTAVDELVQAQLFLGGLAKADLGNLDYEGAMQGFLASVANVSVIGETMTSVKVRDLSGLVNRQFIKCLGELLPLGGLRGELSAIEEARAAAKAEIARLLAAMTHHNENRKNDPDGFAALERSYRFQTERASRLFAEEMELRERIGTVQRQHGAVMLDFADKTASDLDDAVFAIRAELELETDEEAFRAQTVRFRDEVKRAMEELNSVIAAHAEARDARRQQRTPA